MNVDFADALRARAEEFGLSVDESTSQRLHRYFELLAHWNRRINLTALPLEGYPAATIDRLLLEPLVAAAAIDPNADLNVLDLGSGGGSPAIPLAIARPRLRMTMVESRERKCSFLREVERNLELKSSRVICARFEDLKTHQLEAADLITLRAVRVDNELNAVIDHLMSSTGRLFVFGAADLKSFGPYALSATQELPGSLHPLAIWKRSRQLR